MHNKISIKSGFSLVRCSEWIRHASLVVFVASAGVGFGALLTPFLGNAACDESILGNLLCVGQQAYGPGEPLSPVTIVANIINVFLGLLGILFVVLLLYGGFLWMTARGDSKQVDKAKDLIKEAVIGLTIILSAWAVSYFVISGLLSAVTDTAQ